MCEHKILGVHEDCPQRQCWIRGYSRDSECLVDDVVLALE